MPQTKSKGARRGRQPDASSKSGKIRELLTTGISVAEIAKKVGCTTALVYNVKARASSGPKRGPGRPPKAKAGGRGVNLGSLTSLDGIISAVKQSEQQRTQLRGALERIQAILADALA